MITKKIKNAAGILSALALSITLMMCSKSSDNNNNNDPIQADTPKSVVFNFSGSGNAGGRLANGCAELSDSRSILVTIVADSTGSRVVYDKEKIDVYKLGTEFVSKTLKLNVGYYKLTEFMVIDDQNTVSFLVPKQGSLAASLVPSPLPITLIVSSKTDTLKTTMKVVSTCANSSPSNPIAADSFGYAGFTLQEVKDANNKFGVTLIHGRTYKTVKIGTQTWMAENLNDANHPYGVSAYYNNITDDQNTYGRLYNWDAAMSIDTAISGWHLPSNADWDALAEALGEAKDVNGYYPNAGALLKAGGSSGFEALLGGTQNSDGNSLYMGNNAYFWSSSPDGSGSAWFSFIYSSNATLNRSNGNSYFRFSVRLLKD